MVYFEEKNSQFLLLKYNDWFEMERMWKNEISYLNALWLTVFEFGTTEHRCSPAAPDKAWDQHPQGQLLGEQWTLPDQPGGQSLSPTAGARAV